MPLAVVRLTSQEPVFSPYSGELAHDDHGPNEDDPTLLFAHLGDCAEYAYFGSRTKQFLRAAGFEGRSEGDPVTVAAAIDVPGGVMFEVDGGWDGINRWAFAPVS